jgi:Pilus formation protein N terminal region
MAALVRRGGQRSSVPGILACLAFLVAVGMSGRAAAEGVQPSGETIRVVLDKATLIKLPERTNTLVVGNPLIADVSVQTGGILVVTGKGYGVTNLVALDRAGALMMENSIEVVGPQTNVVVVYRGADRESYSCAPKCERRITLGDTPAYFAATLSQTGTLNTQAQGGLTTAPPR